jgi:hypothetical protein
LVNLRLLAAIYATERAFGEDRNTHVPRCRVGNAGQDPIAILGHGSAQSHLHHADPQPARSLI